VALKVIGRSSSSARPSGRMWGGKYSLCPQAPLLPAPVVASFRHALHQDARRRQRLRVRGPLRGTRGEAGIRRDRGERPAQGDRLGRADPAFPVARRGREDGHVQRGRQPVGDVRERAPLPRAARARPRRAKSDTVRVETDAGVRTVELTKDGARADMGPPALDPAKVPCGFRARASSTSRSRCSTRRSGSPASRWATRTRSSTWTTSGSSTSLAMAPRSSGTRSSRSA